VGTYCCVAVYRRACRLGGARRFGTHRGRRGAGISWRLQLVVKLAILVDNVFAILGPIVVLISGFIELILYFSVITIKTDIKMMIITSCRREAATI